MSTRGRYVSSSTFGLYRERLTRCCHGSTNSYLRASPHFRYCHPSWCNKYATVTWKFHQRSARVKTLSDRAGEGGTEAATCLQLVCTSVGNRGSKMCSCLSSSDQTRRKWQTSGRQMEGASRWFGSWFGTSKKIMELPKGFLCTLVGSPARVENLRGWQL